MSTTITAERTSTDLPLELLVARGGGTTGLTCVVALRDGATDGDYLDFADGTFKAAGWTTRQSAMVEISAANAPGKYVLRVDLSSLTIPAATDYLVAEYAVSGTVTAVAQDVVELVASAYDLPADIDAELSGTHGAGAWTTATGFAVPGDAMDLVTDAVDASAVATTGAEEIRDSILSDSTPFAGANIDAAISSRSSHSAADVDTVLTASHGAGSWAGAATAPQVIRDAMKLAPTAGAPAAGSIDAHLDTVEADTSTMEPLVSTNLNATVSSRSSHSAADVDTTLSASHGAGSWLSATGFAVAGDAMDLVVDAVDASAVAATGAAEIRDAILTDATPFAGADIDAAISSRSSHSASDVDTVLTASHGAGSWAGLATAPQVIRDAMKLAPTAGAPAAGSIDEALDTIEADTAAIEPLVSTNVDATISSRSSHSAADVDTVLSASHGAGSWVGSVAPQDIRDAMKLAPSAGAPAAGSVDDHLDTIEADANALETRITVARAAALDEVTSARLSELDAANLPADVTAILADTTAGGPGPWTTGGGGGLTSQQVRDAMKLAPTVGAPAAGSVDAELDDILADTSTMEPLVSSNLDASVSSRSSHTAADAASATMDEPLSGHTTSGTSRRADLASLYGRKIWISVGTGSPGSVLGVNGTEANPVDNMADALVLAAALGVKSLHICGSVTLAAPLAGFAVDGVCTQNFGTAIDINGQDVSGTTFTSCRIQGAVAYSPGEYPTFVDCYLGFFGSAVTGLAGTLYRCGIGFSIELIDGGPALLVDCYTALGDVGSGNPSRLIFPAAGAFFSNVVVIGYRGDVVCENMDHPTDTLTGTITGSVELDATCSAGTVHVSGVGDVVDGSTGTTIVDDQLVSRASVTDAVWAEALAAHETVSGSAAEALAVLRNRIRIDFTAGPPRELVVYDQAGTTELYRAELTTTNGAEVLAFFGVQHERGSPA